MQISDMEAKTGLDRATIRFYEKEGLVVPEREDNGYRIYKDEDLQLLLKIKLLRQLGVPLLKIKVLQQGSGDFSQILQEQIAYLENKIQADTHAKLVCLEMQKACVTFSGLDAMHYLKMLETPIGTTSISFQEPVRRESHPVRRFFARMIDVQIVFTIVLFLLVVVLRIRPILEYLPQILWFFSFLLVMPVEAAFLHKWGTTPGKWIMGIHLEDANGGNLTFNDALLRSMYIIRYGYGFGIPIWMHIRLYKGLHAEDNDPWNSYTEISYPEWTKLRKIMSVLTVIAIVALRLWCGTDGVLPPQRGELTLEDFSQNYRAYESMFGYKNNQYYMNDTGTWEMRENNYEIVLFDMTEQIRKDFKYDLSNGYVTGVHFEDQWQKVDFFNAMPYYCQSAIFAFIGGQRGTSYMDLIQLEKEIAQSFGEQFDLQPEDGTYTGGFVIHNTCVSWEISLSNIDDYYNGVLYSSIENSTYHLKLNVVTVE